MPVSEDFLENRAIFDSEEKPMQNLLLQLVLVLAFSFAAGADEVTYVLQTPGVV